MKNLLWMLLAGMVAFGFTGCAEREDEAHPRYRKAMELREQGNYQEAATELRRFLGARPNSGKGLMAMGNLCSEQLRDPFGAVYFYQEFLRVDSTSADAETVKGYLSAVRSQINEAVLRESPEAKVLAEENATLKSKVARYANILLTQQKRIDQLKKGASGRPAAPAANRKPAKARR